MLTFANFDRE